MGTEEGGDVGELGRVVEGEEAAEAFVVVRCGEGGHFGVAMWLGEADHVGYYVCSWDCGGGGGGGGGGGVVRIVASQFVVLRLVALPNSGLGCPCLDLGLMCKC